MSNTNIIMAVVAMLGFKPRASHMQGVLFPTLAIFPVSWPFNAAFLIYVF